MSTLAAVRRPEFTGENRCWPCTAVNVAVLAVAVPAVARFRPLPAVVLAVLGVAGITLRGYVVPYTPRFAPAVAAALPGDWFGHGEDEGSLRDVGDDDTPEDVLELLVAAGVVRVDGDHLAIDEDVAEAWRERMRAADDDWSSMVAVAERDLPGVDSARVERAGDETYVVVTGGSAAWLRLPVAVAELAAVDVLAGTDLPAASRAVGAHALCAFLETCPVCCDDLVEGAADDCCGHTLAEPGADPPTVLACEPCGVTFYTLDDGTGGDG